MVPRHSRGFSHWNKGGLDPAANASPEGEEGEHLVVGLLVLDVGGCVEKELGLGILGEEG